MADLITLEQAKSTLSLQGTTEHDALVLMMIEMATARIVRECVQIVGEDAKAAREIEVAAWTAETVDQSAKAAILALIGFMFRWRGDEEPKSMPMMHGGLPPAVAMHLKPLRDPAVA